jgi:hypothetical protein
MLKLFNFHTSDCKNIVTCEQSMHFVGKNLTVQISLRDAASLFCLLQSCLDFTFHYDFLPPNIVWIVSQISHFFQEVFNRIVSLSYVEPIVSWIRGLVTRAPNWKGCCRWLLYEKILLWQLKFNALLPCQKYFLSWSGTHYIVFNTLECSWTNTQCT